MMDKKITLEAVRERLREAIRRESPADAVVGKPSHIPEKLRGKFWKISDKYWKLKRKIRTWIKVWARLS